VRKVLKDIIKHILDRGKKKELGKPNSQDTKDEE